MSQLRFGIVGTGMIAGVVAEAIAKATNARLTAPIALAILLVSGADTALFGFGDRDAADFQRGSGGLASAGRLTSVPAGVKAVPPEMRRLIGWLPADTEAIVGANAFTLTKPGKPPLGAMDWSFVTQALVLHIVPDEVQVALAGRRLRCAVTGGRDIEPVSSMGKFRFQGATILLLEQPLGKIADEIRNRLRKHETAVRKINGLDVIVLPLSASEKEGRASYVKDQRWEGRFVVVLNERTIISGTSERYLEQLLGRAPGSSKKTVEAPADPQWSAVTPDADLWLIRRLPARDVRADESDGYYPIEALVWTIRTKALPELRVTYWPFPGVKVDKVDGFLRAHLSPLLSVLLPQAAIRWRQKDGTVQLICDLSKIPPTKQEGSISYFVLLNLIGLHFSIE